MPNSLSVLLPVKNAQATLAATVQEILDVTADLAERFELLIIDDGSADATSEVATELTRHFPQVRAIHQGRSTGREAAIQSGIEQSRGEVVLLHEENGGSPLSEIACLWRASTPRGRFFLPPQSGHAKGGGGSLTNRNAVKRQGFRVLGRKNPESENASSSTSPNYLARLKEFAFGD